LMCSCMTISRCLKPNPREGARVFRRGIIQGEGHCGRACGVHANPGAQQRSATGRNDFVLERFVDNHRRLGRSSDFRIALLTAPSREILAVACCGVRPRLQRRDRDGFAPSSLFFPFHAE
jgi:hypothetical protein